MNDKFSHSRSGSHVYSARVKRSIISWIRHQPILSAFMIFACAVLVIIKFEYSTEKLEKAAALSELAKRTRSYSAHSTKVALVVPKTRRDDLRWLRDYLQTQQVKAPQLAGSHTNRMPMVRTDNTPFIYSMDKRPEKELLTPHSSRGREASAYLSFIVDLYDNLPEYAIFVHADPDQWHNDLFGPQTSNTLPNLRLEAVNAMGYLNLRCTNNPGCPAHINTNSPSQEDIDSNDARANFPRIYKDIFGEDAHVPDTIGGICCAQFAVSRARIQERPKSDYIRMLNWVDEKSIPFVDNYGVGWVFETLWHVVFGMEGVHCPVYEQCRCDNYGWCGPLPSGKTLTPIRAPQKKELN